MTAIFSLPLRTNRPNLRSSKSPVVVPSNTKKKQIRNPYKKTTVTNGQGSKKKQKTQSKRATTRSTRNASICSDDDVDSTSSFHHTPPDTVDPTVDLFEDILMDMHLTETGDIREMEFDIIQETTTAIFEDEEGNVQNMGLGGTSKRMYQRYQDMYKDFCRKCRVPMNRSYSDTHLVKFFNEMKKSYSPSTLWVIYSCINRWFITTLGKKLNDLPRLKILLKNISSRYVAKKSKVFTPEQIHTVLMECQESDSEMDTLMGVGVACMYFGLLRSKDVLNVTVEDVKCNSEGKFDIRFEHMRKRRNQGFTYTIPVFYTPLFKKYMKQINMRKMKSPRFLKNFNKRCGYRFQNCGINTVRSWVKKMCSMLRISEDGYTSHCFRRSAATNLADAGVSFINLKRHGQWKSDAVVEGYIANSKPMRIEREVNLVPAGLRDAAKNLVALSTFQSNPATFTARSNAHNEKDVLKASRKIRALLEDESSGGGYESSSEDEDYDPDDIETVTYANISSIDSIGTYEEEKEQETQPAPVIFSSQVGEDSDAGKILSTNGYPRVHHNHTLSQIVIHENVYDEGKSSSNKNTNFDTPTKKPRMMSKQSANPTMLPAPFVSAAQHARNATAVTPLVSDHKVARNAAIVSPLEKLMGSSPGTNNIHFEHCTFNFA